HRAHDDTAAVAAVAPVGAAARHVLLPAETAAAAAAVPALHVQNDPVHKHRSPTPTTTVTRRQQLPDGETVPGPLALLYPVETAERRQVHGCGTVSAVLWHGRETVPQQGGRPHGDRLLSYRRGHSASGRATPCACSSAAAGSALRSGSASWPNRSAPS